MLGRKAKVIILTLICTVVALLLLFLVNSSSEKIEDASGVVESSTSKDVLTGSELASEIRRYAKADNPMVTNAGSFGATIELVEGTSSGKCGNNAVDGKLLSDAGISTSTVYNKGTKYYINPSHSYTLHPICDGGKVIGTYYSLVD